MEHNSALGASGAPEIDLTPHVAEGDGPGARASDRTGDAAGLADPDLARLFQYLAGGLDIRRLAHDLGESGFGPFSLGEAKRLHELFAAAVAATQGTAAAGQPWAELRRLADRLAHDGHPAASLEIVGGVGKQAARHPHALAFIGDVEADRRTWEQQLASLSAELRVDAAARADAPEGLVERGGPSRWPILAGGVVVAALAAAGIFVWAFGGGGQAPQMAAVELAASPSAEAGAEPAPEVRQAVASVPQPEEEVVVPLPRARPQVPPRPVAAAASPSAEAAAPAAATPAVAEPGAIPAGRGLDPDDPLQVAEVQQRLADLGYFDRRPDGIWGPRSQAALARFKASVRLPEDGTADAAALAALFDPGAPTAVRPLVASAGSAPVAPQPEAPAAVPAVAEVPVAGLDPRSREDAASIQSRLFDLGYYGGVSDGVWGSVSRQALRDFKTVNGLPADDSFDAATEARLMSAGAEGAGGTMIGTWAPHESLCPTAIEPGWDSLRITTGSIAEGGRICSREQVRRTGDTWSAVGDCGGSRTVFRYRVDGGRLVDQAGSGQTYARCPAVGEVGMSASAAPLPAAPLPAVRMPVDRATVPAPAGPVPPAAIGPQPYRVLPPPPPPPGYRNGGYLQPLIEYGQGLIRQ